MDLAPIQRKLPEELLLSVLARLPPYELGRAQVVCKQWRALCAAEPLWQPACAEAFRLEKPDAIASALRSQFRCGDDSLRCAAVLGLVRGYSASWGELGPAACGMQGLLAGAVPGPPAPALRRPLRLAQHLHPHRCRQLLLCGSAWPMHM